jgi:hypothetical protein
MFTIISFGMCAYLATGLSTQHPTMVMVGDIDNGMCNPVIFFPDTHGQRAVINGHEYQVDVNDNGATLYFDSKVFHFVKDSI